MNIFETHAHLNFDHYKNDREKLLKQCQKEGISKIINIGVDEKSSKESIELAEKYNFIYASVGYHPHDATKYDESVIKKLLKHKKVVAIGEIGLDYYRNRSPKKIQKEVFEKQILIAIENDLPIIVHDRDAHEDCFEILSKHNPKKVVFHCFAGDELFAQKVLDKNWIISFTGTITFKNSNQDNIIRMVPADQFFIETDSPYLTPSPNRGKRNSPLNLRYVIEKIADIKRIPPKIIAQKSFENANKFFFDK
ncbi:MAG: TatD family hydrolase [Candidatus Cloacimonadota bacterium]|nr:TatD family hydrolase [Candidatus Cloacimonadota bacterium]